MKEVSSAFDMLGKSLDMKQKENSTNSKLNLVTISNSGSLNTYEVLLIYYN